MSIGKSLEIVSNANWSEFKEAKKNGEYYRSHHEPNCERFLYRSIDVASYSIIARAPIAKKFLRHYQFEWIDMEIQVHKSDLDKYSKIYRFLFQKAFIKILYEPEKDHCPISEK